MVKVTVEPTTGTALSTAFINSRSTSGQDAVEVGCAGHAGQESPPGVVNAEPFVGLLQSPMAVGVPTSLPPLSTIVVPPVSLLFAPGVPGAASSVFPQITEFIKLTVPPSRPPPLSSNVQLPITVELIKV